MKLSELIAAYGDAEVCYQKLDDDADKLRMNNGITHITFGTTERIGPNGTIKMGLVVWMDRDKVQAIIDRSK
ncbi:hypothetical protein [Tritonibacter mobilis]|uniref:hypothetical protein n=1 Tax=Tritonibacter mobilis TaxID=379347 RepID=UPI0039A659F2